MTRSVPRWLDKRYAAIAARPAGSPGYRSLSCEIVGRSFSGGANVATSLHGLLWARRIHVCVRAHVHEERIKERGGEADERALAAAAATAAREEEEEDTRPPARPLSFRVRRETARETRESSGDTGHGFEVRESQSRGHRPPARSFHRCVEARQSLAALFSPRPSDRRATFEL